MSECEGVREGECEGESACEGVCAPVAVIGLVEVGVPSTWHRVPHPHLRPRHWEK